MNFILDAVARMTQLCHSNKALTSMEKRAVLIWMKHVCFENKFEDLPVIDKKEKGNERNSLILKYHGRVIPDMFDDKLI